MIRSNTSTSRRMAFSRIDQHHSIADKMGDIFVQYDLPKPEHANNRRIDGWRLCYTLFDTGGLAVLDSCEDVIDSIPKLMRDEKNIEDAQKEGYELFLDVCESFRYGVMSYASEQAIPRELGHRKAHRCRNPAPFSSDGHRCSMKRPTPTPKLRVLRRAPNLCTLPPS